MMGIPLPAGVQATAEHIVECAGKTARLNTERGDVAHWAAAVNLLLDQERFAAAHYAVGQLRVPFPDAEFVNNLTVVLENLPAQASLTPFFDDPTREIQIAKRQNADTVVLLFCGGGTYRLGMPLNAFHRWGGQMHAHLIYLRDFRDEFFLDGVGAIGGGLGRTLEFLRHAVDELGARRILCYGFSVGGFAALHYGLLLHSERVLALGAPVNLQPGANLFLRWARAARRLHKNHPGLSLDMVQHYRAAPTPPRVTLMYGEDNWDDRLHAERMRGCAFAGLRPVAKFAGHNPVIELIRRGEFQPVLQEFCRV
ncbi:MAG TPA: hypothetical protein VKT22_13740 [Steroidobacteraceae bacterium]|nr:hypothetical protein [Steroidobacteraceae bacterium]